MRTLTRWFRPVSETTEAQVPQAERVSGYPSSEMTPRSPMPLSILIMKEWSGWI